MRIALVCPASLPATQFGGILFLCVDIARELSAKNHDVTIYTTDLDFANNPKTFNKNLPRIEKTGKFTIKRTHVLFSVKLFFVNPRMYFQMCKDDIDIIHSIGVRSFQSFIAALVSKKRNIPLVISDQGGLTTHPEITNGGFLGKLVYKLQKPMIKFIINQATRVSVANEYEEEIFLKFTTRAKIRIIRNGINLDDFGNNISDFKTKYSINYPFILFVGRFHSVKGVDILIRAFNSIKNNPQVKNTKLVIMGVDFGFQSKMLEMIKQYGLEDKIIVIKKPPREDVISAYAACEFLVLPSRWELSPLTPLEGFAFKKPVISTRCHGIPFTVKDGENGILIELENYQQLASAIVELLNDNVKREKYGEAGFNLVKNVCNSKIMSENTLKIYEEIVR
jgi:glycosyltransferase involved in cell wall biosynthesis